MTEHNDAAGESPVVAKRWAELAVALLLMALASLVIFDSTRIGTGWSDDGPSSGYFPFRIGVILFICGLWIAVAQMRRWRSIEPLADRDQLRSVLAVLVPMVIYVAAIAVIGIYLASAVLIGWFMLHHGQHARWLCFALPIAIQVAIFLTFERWFLVPLPKGELGSLLGL
jgi:putative tricarboxylic transport membrane protein